MRELAYLWLAQFPKTRKWRVVQKKMTEEDVKKWAASHRILKLEKVEGSEEDIDRTASTFEPAQPLA